MKKSFILIYEYIYILIYEYIYILELNKFKTFRFWDFRILNE